MNYDIFSSKIANIGGGFFIGMLIGYFLRKILKLVVFALGGVFSLLVYLQYQGLVTVNRDNVQNAADKIVTTIVNSTSIISQAEGQFNIVPSSIGDLALPSTGSMAVGITSGFLTWRSKL
jgi:uncharacterized membrane protein (Fun14 family)